MSKLAIGIVGLPNVGKSTLFNILTKQSVNAENYPFATIDANVGIVSVPDKRLDKLSEINKESDNKVPTVVEFYDIAGLVKGANKGEGLGNKFLSRIKETDAILHLVRCFEGRDVVHIEGNSDPMRDINIIEDELILKDLEVVDRHLEKLEGKVKTGDKEVKREYEVLMKIKDILESAKPLSNAEAGKEKGVDHLARELNLLTLKKQLFLLNGEESDVPEELKKKIGDMGFDYVIADLGKENIIPDVIKKAYETLNLISFFTMNDKETREWPLKKSRTASEAGGVVHSDFEDNFIKAEVVSYKDLVEAGSWSSTRKKGEIRTEGKNYIVADGDVIYFRTGK